MSSRSSSVRPHSARSSRGGGGGEVVEYHLVARPEVPLKGTPSMFDRKRHSQRLHGGGVPQRPSSARIDRLSEPGKTYLAAQTRRVDVAAQEGTNGSSPEPEDGKKEKIAAFRVTNKGINSYHHAGNPSHSSFDQKHNPPSLQRYMKKFSAPPPSSPKLKQQQERKVNGQRGGPRRATTGDTNIVTTTSRGSGQFENPQASANFSLRGSISSPATTGHQQPSFPMGKKSRGRQNQQFRQHILNQCVDMDVAKNLKGTTTQEKINAMCGIVQSISSSGGKTSLLGGGAASKREQQQPEEKRAASPKGTKTEDEEEITEEGTKQQDDEEEKDSTEGADSDLAAVIARDRKRFKGNLKSRRTEVEVDPLIADRLAREAEKQRRLDAVSSAAATLPSASEKGFRDALWAKIDELRNDPMKQDGLKKYCQTQYRFKHWKNKDGGEDGDPTVAGGGPNADSQIAPPSHEKLATFLLTQPAESNPPNDGYTTYSSFPSPPRRPQSARPAPSKHDLRVEAVREKKRQMDLNDQKKLDELERAWYAKWNAEEYDPMAPGEPEWQVAMWLSIVVAVSRVPKCLVLIRKEKIKMLKNLKRDALVKLFADKMRGVLKRRRVRRAKTGWATIAALIKLSIAIKKAYTMKLTIRIVKYSLRLFNKRKPAHFYLRRFYAKVLRAQGYVRQKIASTRARRLWFLVLFNQHEMKMKGGWTEDKAIASYPDSQRLGGKSTETVAEICALIAAKATNIALDLKMATFRAWFKHHQSKYVHQLRAARKQKETINQLCLEGMPYTQAKKLTMERDGDLSKPFWGIIPAANSIKSAYEKAQKKYEQRLVKLFMARRNGTNYMKSLKLHRFIHDVFHVASRVEARKEHAAEAELISHQQQGDWIYIASGLERRNSTAGSQKRSLSNAIGVVSGSNAGGSSSSVAAGGSRSLAAIYGQGASSSSEVVNNNSSNNNKNMMSSTFGTIVKSEWTVSDESNGADGGGGAPTELPPTTDAQIGDKSSQRVAGGDDLSSQHVKFAEDPTNIGRQTDDGEEEQQRPTTEREGSSTAPHPPRAERGIKNFTARALSGLALTNNYGLPASKRLPLALKLYAASFPHEEKSSPTTAASSEDQVEQNHQTKRHSVGGGERRRSSTSGSAIAEKRGSVSGGSFSVLQPPSVVGSASGVATRPLSGPPRPPTTSRRTSALALSASTEKRGREE